MDTGAQHINIEEELLAVVLAWIRSNTYIYSKIFMVDSDHKSLEMIPAKKSHLNTTKATVNTILLASIWLDHQIQTMQGQTLGICPITSPQLGGTDRNPARGLLVDQILISKTYIMQI